MPTKKKKYTHKFVTLNLPEQLPVVVDDVVEDTTEENDNKETE
jgi:hypothetical protein